MSPVWTRCCGRPAGAAAMSITATLARSLRPCKGPSRFGAEWAFSPKMLGGAFASPGRCVHTGGPWAPATGVSQADGRTSWTTPPWRSCGQRMAGVVGSPMGALPGLCARGFTTQRGSATGKPVVGTAAQQDEVAGSTEKSDPPVTEPAGTPSKAQQLKRVFKEYGAVAVVFHISISLVSLGLCYLAVSGGLDVEALLRRLGIGEAFLSSRAATGTSTFVLAYAVHKVMAPARMSITLVSVPLLVRYLRRVGLFRPPVPKP